MHYDSREKIEGQTSNDQRYVLYCLGGRWNGILFVSSRSRVQTAPKRGHVEKKLTKQADFKFFKF